MPVVKTTKSESLYVSRAEAAALVGVDAQLIDKLIRAGTLRARKLGRRVLLSRAELIAYIEATSWEPPAPKPRKEKVNAHTNE